MERYVVWGYYGFWNPYDFADKKAAEKQYDFLRAFGRNPIFTEMSHRDIGGTEVKPGNFPERKLRRQRRAAERRGEDTSQFPRSLRNIRTKKDRSHLKKKGS